MPIISANKATKEEFAYVSFDCKNPFIDHLFIGENHVTSFVNVRPNEDVLTMLELLPVNEFASVCRSNTYDLSKSPVRSGCGDVFRFVYLTNAPDLSSIVNNVSSYSIVFCQAGKYDIPDNTIKVDTTQSSSFVVDYLTKLDSKQIAEAKRTKCLVIQSDRAQDRIDAILAKQLSIYAEKLVEDLLKYTENPEVDILIGSKRLLAEVKTEKLANAIKTELCEHLDENRIEICKSTDSNEIYYHY